MVEAQDNHNNHFLHPPPSLYECSISDCSCYTDLDNNDSIPSHLLAAAMFCFPPIGSQHKLLPGQSYLCSLHLKLLHDYINKANYHGRSTNEQFDWAQQKHNYRNSNSANRKGSYSLRSVQTLEKIKVENECYYDSDPEPADNLHDSPIPRVTDSLIFATQNHSQYYNTFDEEIPIQISNGVSRYTKSLPELELNQSNYWRSRVIMAASIIGSLIVGVGIYSAVYLFP
jgi:hypothetical protein